MPRAAGRSSLVPAKDRRGLDEGTPVGFRLGRRFALAAAVGVCVLLAAPGGFAQSAKSSLKDPEQAAMFNRVSDRLVCQCGCNMILRVCNHFECPSAIPMRKTIEEKILAGVGEDAIVAGFVEEHGQVVLATPPAQGINLAAWVMPGFMILIGLALVLYFVSGWLAKHKVKPAPERPRLDPAITDRIEEEIKGMDA